MAAPEAQAQGLVLMVDGVADPSLKRKRFSPSGLALDIAQGMEAAWPRLPQAGSVHDSLARQGPQKN
jgi:hypothetical protein